MKSLRRAPIVLQMLAVLLMAPPARGTWACIWDHGTTPPTPFHYQLRPARARGARPGGSPMSARTARNIKFHADVLHAAEAPAHVGTDIHGII